MRLIIILTLLLTACATNAELAETWATDAVATREAEAHSVLATACGDSGVRPTHSAPTIAAIVGTATAEARSPYLATGCGHIPTPDLSDPKDEWSFLILGSDHREGDEFREAQGVHTDSVTLIHVVERESLQVTIMPIARELWVGDQTINKVYRDHGFDGMAQTVLGTFGMELDAIFITDLANFVSFIDDIGGLRMTFDDPMTFACRGVDYEYLGTEVFPGEDLLCMARDRYQPNGYFTRQERHSAILRALWEQLSTQVMTDPAQVTEAGFANPFIQIWPRVAPLRLGKLAVRAALTEVDFRTVSLDTEYLEHDTEQGVSVLTGQPIDYHVYRPIVDLQEWVECAVNWSCDE